MNHWVGERMSGLFEFIEKAKAEPDRVAFLNDIIQYVSTCIKAHQSIGVVQDDDFSRPRIVLHNIDEEFCNQYLAHYYQQDPFKLMSPPSNNSRFLLGPGHRSGVVRLEELVDYGRFVESEYFRDFLKPQNQYHKIICYLKSQRRLLGVISLFRPSRLKEFPEETVQLLKMAVPLISICLENIEIREKTQVKSGLFDFFEKQTSTGIILFTLTGRLAYANETAREILKELCRGRPKAEECGLMLPLAVRDDCDSMLETRPARSDPLLAAPARRTLGSETSRYALNYQFVDLEINAAPAGFLMVTISRPNRLFDVLNKRLSANFGLTDREIEVVVLILEGRRNSEIAQQLFISEFTVKKHIQNIFEKMKVGNRTSVL